MANPGRSTVKQGAKKCGGLSEVSGEGANEISASNYCVQPAIFEIFASEKGGSRSVNAEKGDYYREI